MHSENLWLLWGALFAGALWLLSLLGGDGRWKRTLRSIGLAFGLGFIVFPDSESGAIVVRHVLTLIVEMRDYPYPIGQFLAVSLGVAFWCFWLAVAYVLLGFVPERERGAAADPRDGTPETRRAGPAGERQEPVLDTAREDLADDPMEEAAPLAPQPPLGQR